jgi:hypothetical protein
MASQLKRPEFILGEIFTFSGVVDAVIAAIDHYSRWEMLMSLQEHIPLLGHPLTPFVLVVVGMILIHRSMLKALAESPSEAQSVRLRDEHGGEIPPRVKSPKMTPIYVAVAMGCLTAIVVASIWILNYNPSPPTVTARIEAQKICKTGDCWPKKVPPAPLPRTPIIVTQNSTASDSPNIAQIQSPGSVALNGEAGIIHSFEMDFTFDVPSDTPRVIDKSPQFSVGLMCPAALFDEDRNRYTLDTDGQFEDWQISAQKHRYGFKYVAQETDQISGHRLGFLSNIRDFVFDCAAFSKMVGNKPVDQTPEQAMNFFMTIKVNGVKVGQKQGSGNLHSLYTQSRCDVSDLFKGIEDQYLTSIKSRVSAHH